MPLSLREVSFALPPGVPRVIYEPDWFQKEGDSVFYSAVPKNWWILKGNENSSFMKFHVADIQEKFVGEDSFAQELKEWVLPAFDSGQRFIRWCLDFDDEQVVDCSQDSWELRFSVLNRGGQRRWLFNVNAGAIGPLNYDDMVSRSSGR